MNMTPLEFAQERLRINEQELAECKAALARARAVLAVVEERDRQDAKWGEQNHDDYTWLAILMEEVGEASQETLVEKFGAAANGHGNLREEVVHIAAVALAWIECIDRRTQQ